MQQSPSSPSADPDHRGSGVPREHSPQWRVLTDGGTGPGLSGLAALRWGLGRLTAAPALLAVALLCTVLPIALAVGLDARVGPLLAATASLYAAAVATRHVDARLAGRYPGPEEFAAGLRRLPALLVVVAAIAAAAVALAVLLGATGGATLATAAWLLAVAWLLARFSLAAPATVLDGRWPFGALADAWAASRGRSLSVLVVLAVPTLVGAGAATLLVAAGFPAADLAAPTLAVRLVGGLATVLSGVVTAMALARLYRHVHPATVARPRGRASAPKGFSAGGRRDGRDRTHRR